MVLYIVHIVSNVILAAHLIQAPSTGDVRLDNSKRLEIYYYGEWGTVCDDGFDNNDAKVVCRQLGYSNGISLGNAVDDGTGTIMLDDIKCTGSESRLRNCPSSSWKVHDCTHTEDVGVLCNNLSPVNGGWSNWAQWTTCSSSCGVGLQTRTRQCNNPSTQYGGIYCYGLSSQTRKCNTNFCPVDGGWSTWAMWYSCNVTCGEGIQLRFRSCNHPTPAFGGLKCRSKDSETKQCFNAECPKVIDGGWSTWTNWTACTRLCNGGLMERARNCDSPPPINGGLYCNGTSTAANLCNTVSCSEIADTPLKEETEELYIYQESDRSTKANTGFKEETEELYIYQESDQPTQAFHNSAYIKDYDSKNVAKPGVEFDSCDIYDNCEESCYENY